MNATLARLEALASAPKPWLCTVTLPDGSKREHRQPREAMARAYGQRLADSYGAPFTVTYSPE